jgi:hypothetical protein
VVDTTLDFNLKQAQQTSNLGASQSGLNNRLLFFLDIVLMWNAFVD